MKNVKALGLYTHTHTHRYINLKIKKEESTNHLIGINKKENQDVDNKYSGHVCVSENNSQILKISQNKVKKAGVSLIALVITIIVIIILAAIVMVTSENTIGTANYAKFAHELSEIQDKVTIKRSENQAEGIGEEIKNKGFTKVTIENPPSNFVSFDEDEMTGYWVEFDTIKEKEIKTGREELVENRVTFGREDVYVYDAVGNVYYAKGWLDENEELHYSIKAKDEGEPPAISSVTYVLIEENTKAKVTVVAAAVQGGSLNVTIGGKSANKTGTNTYEAEITKNGSTLIKVTETDGGTAIQTVVIEGIVAPKDKTAPEITNLTFFENGTAIVITGSARDNESKITGYAFTKDGAQPSSYTSVNSNSITQSYTATVDGTYTFWVKNEEELISSQSITVTMPKPKEKYTITYNANGGNLGSIPSTQEKTEDVNTNINGNKPTREGYEFLGWATSAGGSTVEYKPGDVYTGNANLNLYAIWKQITVEVSSLSVSNIEDQTYTGSEIKPEPIVRDGDTVLTNGTHYTLSYANNTIVGTASISITGQGKYTGTKVVTFKITNGNMSSGVTANGYTGEYDDEAHGIIVTLSGNAEGATIKYGTSASNCTQTTSPTYTDVGTYEVYYEVTKANYEAVTGSAIIKINAIQISKVTIETISNQTYTGSAIRPEITVKYNGTTIEKGTDYTVNYANNTTVGKANVTITGTGKFEGSKTVTFEIVKATMNGISVNEYNAEYDGLAHGISISLRNASEGATVKYGTSANNCTQTTSPTYKNVGTYEVFYEITKANYNTVTGSTIVKITAKEIAVSWGNTSLMYTGAIQSPVVGTNNTLTGVNSEVLNISVDGAETNVGTDYTATARIESVTNGDVSNYVLEEASKTIKFEIVVDTGMTLNVELVNPSEIHVYDGIAKEPAITVVANNKQLTSEDYTVSYENNTNAGQDTAKVVITGKGNYAGINGSVNFTIAKRELTVTPKTSQGRVYGETEKAIEYNYTNNVSTETPGFTGALSRDAGNDVGTYAINIGTLALTNNGVFLANNYTLIYEDNSITYAVTEKDITGMTVELEQGTYTYTGEAITPKATITYNGIVLDENDCTVTYTGNITAGQATVTVTGKGNFKGTVTATFIIEKANMESEITATGYTGTYDGKAHGITVNVPSGATVKYGASTSNCTQTTSPTYIDVGTKTIYYEVTKANYNTVTGSATVIITVKEIIVSWGSTNLTYTGEAQSPVVGTNNTLQGVNGEVLNIAVDGAETNVGTNYTATASIASVTGINGNVSNYVLEEASKTTKYEIVVDTRVTLNVTLSSDTYTYDGTAKEPKATVKAMLDGKEVILEETDYDISYSNNVNVNTTEAKPTVTITGKGNYAGIIKVVEFTIESKNIGDATVELGTSEYTYDGTAKTPTVAVESAGKPLNISTDYTVKYENNTNAGQNTAKVIITGIGNYAGMKEVTFTIKEADLALTVNGYTGIYDGKEHSVELSGVDLEDATVTYSIDGITYTSTKPTYKNASNNTVYVKVEKANYNTFTGNATVIITVKEVVVSWGSTTLTYTGEPQAPTVGTNNTLTGVNGEVLNISVDGAETNVGTEYTATARIVSVTNGEATVTLGNIKANIEIQKRDRVTNKGLANAVFEVRKVNGEIIGTYVTDSTGSVKLQVTESGYYQIEECEPPENYLLSEENIKTILVEFEKENSITFLNDKKAGLEIIKVDKDTGKTLANARYRISRTDGSVVGEYTTNNMGTINIQDLIPGWYEVLEISAPTNYLRDESIHKILIKENEVTTLTLTNKELQGIQIIKKDSVTEKPLANATFSIKEVGGSLIGEYTTNEMGVIEIQHLKPAFYELKELSAPRGYLIDTDTKIVEVTSKESVVVEFFNTAKGGLQIKKVDEKTGEPLANAKFRVTTITGQTLGEYTTSRTGFINLPELEDGWYIVEEVLAPDNYILDNTPKTVEVRGDKPTIVEFTNREKGGIQILKVDAATGVPLEGAKFRVTTKNGLLIGEYTTDRQGHINLSGLENGWYTILEVEAPKNYILDDVKRDVEVKGDKNQIVEFTNKMKAGLQILKIDYNTGKPLADAKFRVSKMDGKIIGEYVTSRTGYINIGDLDEGWYFVEEILAPEGYALNTTPQTVKVESNKNQIVEFANKQLAGIEIIKIDEYTKAPLKGARFKVTTKNGDFIGEYETDVVGKITIPNLDAGWYSIQEVLAPKGYILDSTIKDVQVTYYENAIVEFTNRAKAGLQILKKDSVTKEGLKDVKFKISKINGELIGTFITDASGMIYLSSLNEGWYIVQEVSTQNGYKIDTTPRNIEVKSNIATVIEFENIPYSTLIIEKIDGVTTKPIAGVKFNIRKENGEYIGDFTTDYFGQIKLNKTLNADTYIVTEITPIDGYKQDTTTYKVALEEGETELLQVKNFPYGSLKIIKYDNKTKERLEGVKYKLEDEKGNLVGIYKTNENGEILIENKLEAGVFYLLELSSLDSYVTDTEKHRVEISWGKITIIELGNTEITGRIQIIKISSDNNEYTGLLAGSPLLNAKFEIRNEEGELVDTITTSYDGKAISKRLSFGKYIVKESLSPVYYLKDEKEYVVEIDENDEVEILTISNESIKLNVTVDKTGVKETQCLDEIRYDFTNISNNSNTSLDNFIWHDSLPIETKLQKIYTGTWNENLTYKVSYKTNLNNNYKVFRENLFTNQNYELDFTSLNLQIDEYITDYIFEFGTVKAGFSQVESPFIFVRVNKYLKDGREFVNFTEVKGYYNEILVSATDSWKTIIYNKTIKPVKYPKTGE